VCTRSTAVSKVVARLIRAGYLQNLWTAVASVVKRRPWLGAMGAVRLSGSSPRQQFEHENVELHESMDRGLPVSCNG